MPVSKSWTVFPDRLHYVTALNQWSSVLFWTSGNLLARLETASTPERLLPALWTTFTCPTPLRPFLSLLLALLPVVTPKVPECPRISAAPPLPEFQPLNHLCPLFSSSSDCHHHLPEAFHWSVCFCSGLSHWSVYFCSGLSHSILLHSAARVTLFQHVVSPLL